MNATIVLGEGQPRQKDFFRATEKYVAFGGARGGGKSWAVREKAKRLALYWAGIKILIIRRVYADLRDNHILPLRADIPQEIAKYSETDKSFLFVNGSRIRCGYFDNEGDALRYQGQEYDVIFLEEATQFPESVFDILKACVRGANKFPKRMYLTCNPDGIGFAWVKRLFVDREYTERENPAEYRFIQSLVTDNEALMKNNPDYVMQLDSLPPGMRERWRYGSWDVVDGQYFSEWRRDIHVIDPFPIPAKWRRYRGIDYGLDCAACVWIAVSPDNRAYLYREMGVSDLSISEAAKRICSLSVRRNEDDEVPESIYATFAPDDLWSRTQETGRAKSDIFAESGLHLVKTSRNREAGWLAVKELLASKEGTPRLQIFRNCTRIIHDLPLLQIDPKHPSDCMTDPHDITHLPDALRAFAISFTRPAPVEAPVRRVSWTSDQWEDYYNASDADRARLKERWGEPL